MYRVNKIVLKNTIALQFLEVPKIFKNINFKWISEEDNYPEISQKSF